MSAGSTTQSKDNLAQKIISLCKRRGFVFAGSEIYGGLANTYDLGPLGVELLRNVIGSWWTFFVTARSDMYGLDTSILMSPKVWEASGHTQSFTNDMIDCKVCKYRTRADHVIEDYFETQNKFEKVEGKPLQELDTILATNNIKCPKCGKSDWTPTRKFNQLFETSIGIVEESQSLAYLRGEIAQGMFVNFKNVLDSMRPKLPFGIAQAGKAFRNEITLGNFIFRTLEFNLAEFEYFFDSAKQTWSQPFAYWKEQMLMWITSLGISATNLRWRVHTDAERAHYSTHTEDLDYNFPWGFKELFGLAYRTDFDLKNHMEKAQVDLRYIDPQTNEKIMPHVIEPTFGINRVLYCLLCEAYHEEQNRVVLKLAKNLAPYLVAVFPLVANKPELVIKAKEVYDMLKKQGIKTAWDERGNIGKRYFAQDEIGTPFCVTIDYQTLEDNTVTVRDRDTMTQDRVGVGDLPFKFG